MIYFKKGGEEYTQRALSIAKEVALKRGISHVLVASTTGKTGLHAAQVFKDTGVKLIVVTHNTGFTAPGEQEMPEETRRRLQEAGVKVYTGTMVLRSLGAAIRGLQGSSQQDLVANTLRLLGQGMKVCVEMVAMAADAGLIPPTDVLAVAGTISGADTVALISAQPSNKFFEIKVREILAKPREW